MKEYKSELELFSCFSKSGRLCLATIRASSVPRLLGLFFILALVALVGQDHVHKTWPKSSLTSVETRAVSYYCMRPSATTQ